MKKLRYIILVVIGLFAGIALLIIGRPNFSDKSERVVLNIEGRDYILLTARTALEKTRGLSGITELKNADGMVFYFDAPQKITFWNRNTHLDLELVWLNGDKVLGRDFLPSEDKAGLVLKESPAEVDKVVELMR
jgi:uncharacterized membrane protein (UPF0127 family)